MMRALFIVLFLGLAGTLSAQSLKIVNPVCEYRKDPLGLDLTPPRLSWQLSSAKRDVMQTAYEIRVATDASALAKGRNLVWQSGKVQSDQSVHVPYGGPLQSRQRYYWQVRVWDNQKNTSPWSEPAFWEMGLLNPADWSAQWIQSGMAEDTVNGPVPLFRKTFDSKKAITAARAYITSKGVYEAFINGKRIGKAHMSPGWTSYNHHLQYQVYDVTPLISNGSNVIGVMLGNGWYRGPLAWERNKRIYGDKTSLLFQLELTYADGTRETVATDGSWKTSLGPIRSSEIYHGEVYDARQEQAGWMQQGFSDAAWKPVVVANEGKDKLVATNGPSITRHETFKPVKIITTPKGEVVADFGQNLVGLLRIKVKGKAGDKITLHHAEVLDKDGNFYTDNLRVARQEIQYTLKGGAEEVYEPHFTFMGFRYVRVQGFPGQLTPENLLATALYSDMEPTGNFTSSHALINQLQHNIQWGQKGNFLDVPTDCPQRDERLGWTGDAQVFARTAAYNMNAASFFSKWLKDVAADQREDGAVPFVIPNVLGPNSAASAGWADAATIIPWTMYQAFGDTRFLEDQYESMKRWVGYMEKNSKDYLWNTGFHFGDWLFYRPFDDNDGRSAVTDKYLIAQSFFAHSTQLLANAAKVLGKTEDEKRYTELLGKVKAAFVKEYLTPNGRLVSGTQTAYVLALNFDMLPENLRQQTAQKLADNVKSYGNHLTTGFLGTPYLCHVLTRFGYTDVAYTLLLQETYPSWLYPVKMGATTIWERWDGIKPDGTFQTPGMNSFNHYAYGAIGDWMYRVIAGIQEASPGYKKIRIAPQPGGNLTNASASLQTLYGEVRSSWKIENGMLKVDVVIPANTKAEIILPKASGATSTPPVTLNSEGQTEVGPGTYHFEYSWK
ncbi:glycoside hydrolase family 78 protein [Chryseosolibacter histidini]|nr:glycoside hydrolase family 78 protein [Chryseosolibacter histidini]